MGKCGGGSGDKRSACKTAVSFRPVLWAAEICAAGGVGAAARERERSRRLLVAEDNELNWEIAEGMLSELGMELEWAENGRICVEKFCQAQEGWYDAILMDLRMPEMTGFEAAQVIRALNRADAGGIPIIAVSADAFADDVEKCMECGMNAHTAKPYDFAKIVSLLNELL